MGATFVMSYPGADWHIEGGQNFVSQGKQPTNPKAALTEWLRYADAITRAGGRILVMPPAPKCTGLPYTANIGALFHRGNAWLFALSQMKVSHRQAERDHVRSFLNGAGLQTQELKAAWEGQAEICALPGNRVILTWGVRSDRASVDELRALLPDGAHVLEAQIREPFFHGDVCFVALQNRGRDTLLLVHEAALVNRSIPEVRNFLGSYGEVLAVDEEDARAYACNSVCIDGTVLIPANLSTGLRGQLLRRGFKLEEVELPELLGKGGGGPRCLVNQLHGFVLSMEAPSYANQRAALHALVDTYPETSAAPQP